MTGSVRRILHDGVDSPILRVNLGEAPTSAADDPLSLRLGGASTTGIRFGAYLDGGALGTSGWTAAAAEWAALTGIPLSAGRWYAGSSYTIGTTLTQMIAAGVRICLDLAPPYNPVSSSDRTSIASMLASLKAADADVRVSLWHEPFYGGLTASQFTAMIAYYGPTVRQYYPLWAVFSGNDTIEANGYFPGAAQVDGIAADCYATSTANLDNCADLADKYGLPLGLWEFNAANDLGIDPSPVNGDTNAAGVTFLTYVRDLFLARIAAGKPNGEVLFFSATGSTTGTINFLGSGRSQAGGFEGGIANWVAGTNNTVAASSAQAHSGTGSLALTCTTAGTIAAAHCLAANITTQGMPITAGQSAATSCWLRPNTTPRNVRPGLFFYNSSGTFLSNSFASAVAEAAGAWKFFSHTAVAPATAAYAKLQVELDTVALSEVHYLDDPQMSALPASTDHTAPIQYPWDYRITTLAAVRAALDTVVGLGTARLGAIYWFDAGPDLVRYERSGGLGREGQSLSPGSFTGEFYNDSGIYDPLPAVADPGSVLPFTLPAVLRPAASATAGLAIDVGSPLRVTAYIGGVEYPRYFGYIDRIKPNLGMRPTVTITALDGFEVLGRTKLKTLPAPVGDGETSGARIHRILDAAGWPASRRAIDHGQAELIPTTLGDYALPLLQKVVDTELGYLFIDGAGVLTFYDRYRVNRELRSQTVQVTMSDAAGTGLVRMTDLDTDKSRDTLFNRVAVLRDADGAVEQVAEDLISQNGAPGERRGGYGQRDYPGSPGPLLLSDGAALDMARALVGRYSTPELRVAQVTVDGYAQDAAGWAALLALRPLDRVRTVRNYGPSTLDAECWAESIDEQFTPFESWIMTTGTRQSDRSRPLMLGGVDGIGTGQLGF